MVKYQTWMCRWQCDTVQALSLLTILPVHPEGGNITHCFCKYKAPGQVIRKASK